MTIRLIQIGMGGWGRSWAKNILPANKDVTTVAYVDTVPTLYKWKGYTREAYSIWLDNS